MTYEQQLETLLGKAMRTKTNPIGISGYQYCLDERIMLNPGMGRTQEAHADLTLHWEDGSLSRHRLMLPLPVGEELPVQHWRRVRYFDRQRPSRSDESSPRSLHVCDEQILQLAEQPLAYTRKEPWTATYTIHTRKLVNSEGAAKHEIVTEVHLRYDGPYSYSLYHRRKKPDDQELRYLHEEQHWLQAHRTVASGQIRKDAYLLFSPQAIRTLFHCGLAVFLTDRRKGEHLLPFIRFCADYSQLVVSHDPSKAWSLGSRMLASDGTTPERQLLVAPGHASSSYLPRSFDPASLHLDHPHKARFHPLISAHGQVDYVPHLQVPESFSPYAQQVGWAPFCMRFRNGIPAERGCISFPFSLAALIASPRLTLVSKVGWDGFGLAVPYHDLAHHP